MQRKLASALAVVLMLVVAACGSDSKPLSSAELRTQANAVCRDVVTRAHAIQTRATPATMRASLSRAATVYTDGLDRLEALKPPPQLGDRYASFLAWKETQRDAALQLAKADGRLSARQRRAVESHAPVGTLAHGLGLVHCE